jgi:hypothetical protein
MTDLVAVRARLLLAAGAVRDLRSRLSLIRESVPPSPQETSQEDLDAELDVPTELRAVVSHILSCLETVLAALLAVATEEAPRQPAETGAEDGRSPLFGCDLSTENEATRRAIYELVVAESFTCKPLDPPDDVWVPSYTPEQAGLEVVFQWGRWFATWIKLEEPEDRPERERREVLVYEPDSQEPGAVTCYEV